jgi:hypothetical protein
LRLSVLITLNYFELENGTMNDQTEHLDQSEEDILTYAVSDEAIEAAAGMAGGGNTTPLILIFLIVAYRRASVAWREFICCDSFR